MALTRPTADKLTRRSTASVRASPRCAASSRCDRAHGSVQDPGEPAHPAHPAHRL